MSAIQVDRLQEQIDPNPFNRETWIPYELATDTTVKITIYNPQGIVIQTLQFGQQSVGYYIKITKQVSLHSEVAFYLRKCT
ncbi:MAG: hypothetical protein OXD49_17050 [Candidatus Poribacteria bacterium]|nr:hypothetical protein [Candidatus Poribacteria bacterium]